MTPAQCGDHPIQSLITLSFPDSDTPALVERSVRLCGLKRHRNRFRRRRNLGAECSPYPSEC